MKRIIIGAAAGAICLFLAAPTAAQTRADIIDRVIWPCVTHEVEELDLEERHTDAAITIMFELDRDFYEEVINAVEAGFREEPDDHEDWIYEAGLAACIQNQGSWSEEPEAQE